LAATKIGLSNLRRAYNSLQRKVR